MRRGDIIVNPWVSVDYCGELNPMYATIYLGNNFSLDYKGRKHTWADKVYKQDAEHRCPWKVIGHIDLDEIIETAIRKAVEDEPNNSEKPNNCKYADNPSGDVWECGCFPGTYCEHQIYDRNPDGTINIVECGCEPKDEPQTDAYDYKGNGKWERSE